MTGQTLPRQLGLMRDVTRLAVPTVLEGLLMTLVQYIDTAMVGGLGAVATAAVAVNAAPTWLLSGVLSAVVVGGTAVVARAYGAGQREEAEQAAYHMLLGGILLSACFAALALGISGLLPRWMGAEDAVLPQATGYLRIIAIGFVPQYIGVVLAASLRGAGDMKTPMVFSVVINLVNVVGNYFLIYETHSVQVFSATFTMPGAGWGVLGAAASTAFSTALYGLLIVLRMRGRQSRLRLRRFQIDRAMLRRIFRVGIPAAMERVAINLGQILFARMVTSFGTQALAAHHLAISIESLAYQPGFGVSQAATTLVGQSLGAENPDRAQRAGLLCNRLGVVLMTLASLLMVVFATPLMRIFTPDPQVVHIGSRLLYICAVYEPFFAMSIVMTGALRGAGDTRVPFYVSLVSMWGLRLVVGWVCAFPLGFGVYGAWVGMCVDIYFRGIMMYIRFRKGKWKTMVV